MGKRWIAGALAMGVLSVAATAARDSRACGGCFIKPTENGSVVTDHRMIFRVSPQQTTLYDQIEYAGDPTSFAWVLPIKAPVTVGLSSDVVFQTLDSFTQTTIQAPPYPCQVPVAGGGASSGGGFGGPSAGDDAGSGVIVIGRMQVGPYDTVQLRSTDPNALNAWLAANGYDIPVSVQPIIAAYIQEGFDFLALRLEPGQGVSAMRPISVTSPGGGLSLPLRMVAAGTGATVGITLWVIGDGRYEPQNFLHFTIPASNLAWDWAVQASDYTTVRKLMEDAFNDAAWQIESSLEIPPYEIEARVLAGQADVDYLPTGAADAGTDGGGDIKTALQVRAEDLATLFPAGQANVRITRMRGDLTHAALATDLVLQASADQSELSNVYSVTQSINSPCGGTPSSNGGPIGSSSGPSGSSGGVGSSSSSGAPGTGSSSSSSGSGNAETSPKSGGCTAAPQDSNGAGIGFAIVGLLGVGMLRSRRRRASRA